MQRKPIPFPTPTPTSRTAPIAVPDVRRAKLQPPRLPADVVRRPALEMRLERAADAPLTLVAAGAGFGKTTLLAAWAGATARRVAWLSLDAEDADLRRFLRHLLAALRTVAPGIAPAMDDLLGGGRPPDAATAAAVLGDELLDLPDETVLVLDDLHAVAGAAPTALLSALLRYPPPDLRIVAASRIGLEELGLRLAGSLPVEAVGERDLRLAEREVAALLGASSPMVPAEVAARTDGWAAGVRALALAGDAAAPGRVREYLADDALAGQPADLVAFLRAVAILERTSPELAGAVAGVAPERAAALLAQAERRGLFTSRLDDGGGWWRIHQLLRDALLADVAPQEREAAHARAAAWFAVQGAVEETVDHALQAGDAAVAADLVARFAVGWLEGEEDIFYHWIERLHPAEVAARPALLLVRANHLLNTGNEPGALMAVDEAEGALRQPGAGWPDPLVRTLEAEAAVIRGATANQVGDPGLLLVDSAGTMPGREAFVSRRQRLNVLLPWSFGMALRGRTDEALADLEPLALAELRSGGLLGMRLPIGIAGLHLRMARFAEARRWVALTEDAPETPVGVFMIVWGALVRAVSARQEDDLAAAERAARAGIAAAPGRFFFTKRQLADVLARTLLAEGRVDEARIAAAEDRRRLELAGAVGLLPGLEALEAEIALAAGDRAAARRWADAATPPFLPDPVRMVDHSALAQARIWLDRDAPGDAARAAALLARLRDHQAATHHALGQLRTLPLLAAAQEAAGDRIAARETMRATLEHERGATPRRFADAGSRAAALLAGIAADEADPLADPATRVLAALGEDDGQPLPAGPSPLTDRQREILAMVAEMRTNKEIGEALGITPVTARDHLRRIFARLDVGDRRSAVEVARAAGWL